jgi:glutamate formiminotransferase/formiminotetrahydrofolate cyclodeaminase
MKLIECVPNFSEGKRADVVSAIRQAAEETRGVTVLDAQSDPNHNRMVLTFVGAPQPVKEAALAASARAIELIDLGKHVGEHPRMGAVDVVPFIPLTGATMEDCIVLAKEFAQEFAKRFSVPVYLYEQASGDARKDLAKVRQGQFEGLRKVIGVDSKRDPDFGPKKIHPTAGATAVGARQILIAYNVDLNSQDLSIAKKIANKIRERDGGLPAVKALGFELRDRKLIQVSMNLIDYSKTSMDGVFYAISNYAKEFGVSIADSEIVGLVPQDAINQVSIHSLSLRNFTDDQIIENRIASLIIENSAKGNFLEQSLYDFSASIASKDPIPGGGSVAAYSGALAASLVMMVSHSTIGKKNYETSWEPVERILRQAEPLKEKLLLLVDKDAEAYSLVASSLKLPKETGSQMDARQKKLEDALKKASETPEETMLAAYQVYQLAKKLREIGNKNAFSDVVTASELSRASILGAWSNVKQNLDSLHDTKFVNDKVRKLRPIVDEISATK